MGSSALGMTPHAVKKSLRRGLYLTLQKIFLTSKFSYLLFPNPIHKTKIGTAIGERLLITTHKLS
jgi:hypothetical protein